MFDANLFMSAVYEEVNDTKIVPCPAGEFHAQIEKVDTKSGTIGSKNLPATKQREYKDSSYK